MKEPEANVKVFAPGLKTPPLETENELPGVNVTLEIKVMFPVSPIVIVLLVYVPVLVTDVTESN